MIVVKDKVMIFTIVTTIIGFMLAIQFQTTKEPVVRDTRDILQLRQDLRAEKERQQELNEEIEKQLALLSQLQQKENLEDVMVEALNDLRERAGLTEVSGQGIIIDVKPLFNNEYDFIHETIPTHLLRFLINELNIYNAKEIAVANQRIISTSAIRDVNGVTHVNSRRLPSLPLKIKVIADDAQKLHHEMLVSQSVDYFAFENLSLTSTPINYLKLPAYEQSLRVRYLQPIKEES